MDMKVNWLKELSGSTFGLVVMTAMFVLPIGVGYWIWLSYQLQSLAMFVLGIVPPLMLISGPVGIWALFMGTPEWVVRCFGS